MIAVLVVLCPPLAVLIAAGPSQAAKNLGLTLLLYVPGVLHARAAVERYTVNRQYEAVMRVLDNRATPAKPPATRPFAA